MLYEKWSPLRDSNSLRNCPDFVKSICNLACRLTYLTFSSVDYHRHALHVNAALNDSRQVSRQPFLECVQNLCGNGTKEDCQVGICRAELFVK